MRIGILGDALDRQYAGIHYFTKNLIESLIKIDKKNEYFLFRVKPGKKWPNCTEIIVPSYSWLPGYQSARLLFIIPSKVKALKLDAVIEPAHFGPFNLPTHVKRITVIHDLTPILYRQWHTFNGWFLQKLFLPGIITKADLIITNSEYTKSDIVKHLKKDPQLVVPSHLGISNIFKPTIDKDVLGKYGIFKDYILYQGTLEPRKNLINLISAFEIYRKSNPEKKEQLILSGKKGWKIKELIRKKYSSEFNEDIILLGYIERRDMPAIFSSATVFAYPSLYEGFGLPVLEAMACGTPIITSNTSSLPEVAGNHAVYFSPNDIHAMANSILVAQNISDQKREEQVQYAQSFTWDNTARGVIEAISQLKT